MYLFVHAHVSKHMYIETYIYIYIHTHTRTCDSYTVWAQTACPYTCSMKLLSEVSEILGSEFLRLQAVWTDFAPVPGETVTPVSCGV